MKDMNMSRKKFLKFLKRVKRNKNTSGKEE